MSFAGRNGTDFLFGELGQDHLKGGVGNDFIEGGQGDDDLRGGAGEDVFYFDQLSDDDVLHGFTSGTDLIDVSAFGFTNTSQVLSRIVELDAHTALLQLSDDVSVKFAHVDADGTFIVAGDIII